MIVKNCFYVATTVRKNGTEKERGAVKIPKRHTPS